MTSFFTGLKNSQNNIHRPDMPNMEKTMLATGIRPYLKTIMLANISRYVVQNKILSNAEIDQIKINMKNSNNPSPKQ